MACLFGNIYNGCGCLIGYQIPLQTVALVDIDSYPVTVLDMDENALGVANSPSQYADIWNTDAGNAALGKLYIGNSAFCFYMERKTGSVPPQMVLGGIISSGLITEDGTPITDEDGNPIIT